MRDYWNHNTAYHSWILQQVGPRRGSALDVGCGEGLLAERLAPHCTTVLGIDPNAGAAERATRRLRDVPNAAVKLVDFGAFEAAPASFDLITFVATLHHMDAQRALMKSASLLRPGGALLVVGLARNRSFADWAWVMLTWPLATAGSRIHGETRDIGVPTVCPQLGLSEIRATAQTMLPGAHIRRGMYYRYLLSWTKPL